MLPLERIKIIDLTKVLPGRYCTMILGDMGAEVIKIEEVKPKWSPIQALLPDEGGSGRERDEDFIRAWNFGDRNKKSFALNLKTEEGREMFYQLVKSADVIIEGFRPGVVQRLGIDYKRIKEKNAKIIYCSISGYGQDGPYKDLPGHDSNYQGVAGVVDFSLLPEGQPMLNNLPVGDLSGGMQAVIGILLALIVREKTGEGQFVDISITDSLVSWFSVFPIVRSYFISGRKTKPGEGLSHFIFKTKDNKYIVIAPIEPHFWERLCRALEMQEYIPYHGDILVYERVEGGSRRKEIISRLRKLFKLKTREEWLQILTKANTCISPVYEMDEVFQDPHVIKRMIIEIDHHKLGKVTQSGVPIKLSATPGQIRSIAPLHGEHTKEVLMTLGYDKAAIQKLEERGLIFCCDKKT